jgi:hypothetical protein
VHNRYIAKKIDPMELGAVAVRNTRFSDEEIVSVIGHFTRADLDALEAEIVQGDWSMERASERPTRMGCIASVPCCATTSRKSAPWSWTPSRSPVRGAIT